MSGVGLTLTDLSTHDNLVQARHELRRATSEARLAAWADKWGEAACDEIEDPSVDDDKIAILQSEIDDKDGEVAQLEAELSDAHDERDDLVDAIKKAVPAMRARLKEMMQDARVTAMGVVLDELEDAL